VCQIHCEVWQSTMRGNTSMDWEESNALKLSWSFYFKRRKEGLIVEEEPTKLSETWDEGHDTKLSTKWKTPWPRR
jgi:hypothetical protein